MFLNIENKTKQNMCNILLGLRVCVCSSSISLNSDDDTVWHLRRSPCDLNIQSHILFCTVRLFSFPFSQCDCEWISNASKRTSKYISYFKLKHTAVCASMCCSIIAWISTVCSAQKQILGTLYSTQHSLSICRSLTHSLCTVLFVYTIHMYEICSEHWLRVCLICALCLFLFLYLSHSIRLHASV